MQEISLNIMDLAQNSISAKATLIEISVLEDPKRDTLTVMVKDNGTGMPRKALENAGDPFFTTRTTRRVGLGIPFFKMAAEMSGGNFEIKSEPGKGTAVSGVFGLTNIDRMPLGNINETMAMLIYCNPEIDFVYLRRHGEKSFRLDTREMRKALAGVPLNNDEVMSWLREFLKSGENEISLTGPNDTERND